MFELLYRWLARRVGIPLFKIIRRPLLHRWFRQLALTLGVKNPPPRNFTTTTREWAQTSSSDHRKYIEIRSEQVIERKLPRSIYPQPHWRFGQAGSRKTPPVFLATIPNGKVLGAYGSIISADEILLGDLSREWFFGPEQHSALFKLSLPAPQNLLGTTATLAVPSGWNYYHWIVDVLPRVGILEKAGVDLQKVDWFIVNSGRAGFQLETLKRFGIPEQKQIITERGKCFQSDTLLAPSFVGENDYTPPWVVEFLRNKFPAEAQPKSGKKIYVSRARSKYRKFRNEQEVRDLLLKRGFQEVFSEDLSFQEQINVFAAAEAIISAHGAGLTNIAFCRPGTKVIEIFTPNYVNPCFWGLATVAGAEYFYLLGDGPQPPDFHDPHHVEEDITVNIGQLEATLNLAGT